MATPTKPPPPRVEAVPSDRAWFDPRLMLAATQFAYRDVTVPAGVPGVVAVADPTRVAVGFWLTSTLTIGLFVGPWPDPQNGGVALANNQAATWFDVRQHLILPTLAWYAYAPGGSTIRVSTVRRT